MNTRRRRILALGLIVAALVGLYPPWQRSLRGAAGELVQPEGRAFLFLPPKLASVPLVDIYGKPHGMEDSPWTIDVAYRRLFVEWAVILLVTGAVVSILPNEPRA